MDKCVSGDMITILMSMWYLYGPDIYFADSPVHPVIGTVGSVVVG